MKGKRRNRAVTSIPGAALFKSFGAGRSAEFLPTTKFVEATSELAAYAFAVLHFTLVLPLA